MRFWLGGYTDDRGSASGIGVLLAGTADDGSAGGQLRFAGDAASVAGSPSWLAAHPSLDVVYAGREDAGAVQAFRRTGEASLAALGAPIDAGEALCHVAVSPDGGSLVAGCWGDGRVVRMTLDAAGRPSAPVIAAAANDPYGPDAAPAEPAGTMGEGGAIDLAAAARALRQAAGAEFAHLVPGYDEEQADAAPSAAAADAASRVSRAHEAVFLPGGLVATTDLGFDLVRFWRATAAGLQPVQDVVLPLGTGPRHMVWHPSGHLYVVTEFSCEIYALAADVTGAWHVVAGTSFGSVPGDAAAELAPSRDGEFLYAGVRGSNTIATVRVRGAGDSLAPVALVDSGVGWPRHHLVVRDTVLVAGERSSEVASLTLDLRTGVPGRVRERVEAPSPTCLLPAR